jgi:hypothetical protein
MPAEPFVGDKYKKPGGLMLLGESFYPYDEDGQLCRPSGETHSKNLVRWVTTEFEACRSGGQKIKFMVKLSRALTEQWSPDESTLHAAWGEVAFTNYISDAVGDGGPNPQPTEVQWQREYAAFPAFLDKYRPGSLLVLGQKLWSRIPPRDTTLLNGVEAYCLADSSLCFCRVINHPSARQQLAPSEYTAAIRELQCLHT